MFVNLEINNNLMRVDNYRQILTLKNDLIRLTNITIYGNNMMVIRLDDYSIVIKGEFNKLIMNGEEDEL